MQTEFKTTYETVVKAPVEKVWKALTDPQLVKQYFFGSDLSTDWKVGNPIRFSGIYEGKEYNDRGTVLEYTHNKSLSYSYLSDWTGLPDKPENYLVITYAVESVREGTKLRITQTNYDAERAKHSESNWGMVMDGMKKLVE